MASYDGITLDGVKVGDPLLLVSRPRKAVEVTEVTAEKVGRTLVHVRRYGRIVKFRIEDGEQIGPNAVARDERLFTPDGWAAKQAADVLADELRGWRLDDWRRWTPARMRAVLDALEATAV